MRLIDADVLKKDLTRFYRNEVTAKRLIDEQPTIEPETQKTGHWINEGRFANYHGGNVYRCSRCGNHIIEKEPDDFCKYCGSDNRGGDYE